MASFLKYLPHFSTILQVSKEEGGRRDRKSEKQDEMIEKGLKIQRFSAFLLLYLVG